MKGIVSMQEPAPLHTVREGDNSFFLFGKEDGLRGFFYRWAIRLKDFGERHRLAFVTRWGLALRDSVMGCPIGELYGKSSVSKEA
jgi:hypothetical protein